MSNRIIWLGQGSAVKRSKCRARRASGSSPSSSRRTSFDSSARFECRQQIPARVTPKDVRNACELFHPTVRVERETGSTAPTDARKAFDDLFKF